MDCDLSKRMRPSNDIVYLTLQQAFHLRAIINAANEKPPAYAGGLYF